MVSEDNKCENPEQKQNIFPENEKEIDESQNENMELYQNAEKILKSAGENLGENQEITELWDSKYDKLLEAILEFHKFDFAKATEEINRIVSEIENKFNKKVREFSEEDIRKKWTEIEVEIRGKDQQVNKRLKEAELEELE